jgi:hypothetical protein
MDILSQIEGADSANSLEYDTRIYNQLGSEPNQTLINNNDSAMLDSDLDRDLRMRWWVN